MRLADHDFGEAKLDGRGHGPRPVQEAELSRFAITSLTEDRRLDFTGEAAEPEPMDVASAANLLEALGNPTRLRIYIELSRGGDTGMSVGALQERLGIDAKSTLSNHLRQLVQVGLVSQERRSTTLLCRAHTHHMSHLVEFLQRAVARPGDGPPE